MRSAWLLASILASLIFAGCVDDADPATTDPTGQAATNTYTVPVTAAHVVDGDARTIRIVVSEDGKEIGSATYDTTGKATDVFETLLTIEATGPVNLKAYDGSTLANTKTIDPTRCVDPDFQLHVTNDAVHLWSNCD